MERTRMRNPLPLIFLLASVLTVTAPASAAPPDDVKGRQGQGKAKGGEKGKHADGKAAHVPAATAAGKRPARPDGDAHEQVRHHWVRDWQLADFLAAGFSATLVHQLAGVPGTPVLVDVQPLPPGIRKNLARGKPLPPGLARRTLPAPVVANLPRVVGYEWQAVGTDLVLVQLGTMIVAELILDALN